MHITNFKPNRQQNPANLIRIDQLLNDNYIITNELMNAFGGTSHTHCVYNPPYYIVACQSPTSYYVIHMKNQIKSLAIETSGRLGSVAVGIDDRVLAEKQFSRELRHTVELLPIMDSLCKEQGFLPGDIEHLYVSAGPGSFTGIRVAITLAKTLAYAQKTRIIPVPSIEAQVLNAIEQNDDSIENIAVILEAGRGNIFTAAYKRSPAQTNTFTPGFEEILPKSNISPEELLKNTSRPLHILGEGIRYHREELTAKNVIIMNQTANCPQARHVYSCGHLRSKAGLFASEKDSTTDALELQPIYMRRPEAIEKWEELHGK